MTATCPRVLPSSLSIYERLHLCAHVPAFRFPYPADIFLHVTNFACVPASSPALFGYLGYSSWAKRRSLLLLTFVPRRHHPPDYLNFLKVVLCTKKEHSWHQKHSGQRTKDFYFPQTQLLKQAFWAPFSSPFDGCVVDALQWPWPSWVLFCFFKLYLEAQTSAFLSFSGESGAGKTESTKLILKFLSVISQQSLELSLKEKTSCVEQAILESRYFFIVFLISN